MPDYEKAAERAARKYKVDPRIFKAMIRQESGFRQGLTSPKGAQGIAQFIPSTAKAYGVNLHDNRATDDLEGAARYLRDNLKRTGGNYHRALSIYNSGRPEGYKHIAETSEYVQRILKGSKGERTTERGGSSSSSPTSKTVTKSRTIPGVDRSDERRQVILRFLQERHRPGAVADLATGLRDTKDTPSVRATSLRTVRQPGSPGSPRGGFPKLSGDYKGAHGAAADLAAIGKQLGLQSVSEKRHNTNPYSGSRSDHDVGNQDAYAFDLSNGGAPTPEMDRAAFRIARKLGIKDYKMGQPIMRTVQRNGVRVQVIYRGSGPAFGGNHLNHVHVGVKNVRGSGGRDSGVVR